MAKGYGKGAMPAIRGARRCVSIAPAELGSARCIMPAGASGHEKWNDRRAHTVLQLPVLLHRSQDAEHWTIYGPVKIERPAPVESDVDELDDAEEFC